MDSYFPEAHFFTEFERFDRHVDKLRREDSAVDFVSICSPNYLHDAHIRFGLRNQAHVICEKPLVLNPWNIDALAEIEQESGKRVYNILQLRLHPSIMALKNASKADQRGKYTTLTYLTLPPGQMVRRELERRTQQIRRHRHQHRRSLF